MTPSAADVNREFYEQALPGRDDYWQKMAAPRSRVAQILSLLSGLQPRRVVDLGSGGGQLLSEIRARLPDVALAGIDISAAQVRENARRHPTIDWYLADLDAPPGNLPGALAGSFDVVLATELIEHLDHPEALLRNACELARQGEGRLILSTQSGPLRETERRVGHRRHWTRAQMSEALLAAGWSPERIWNCGYPFHDLSKWYANLDPDGSMTQFAEKPYGFKQNLVCSALRTAFRLNSRRVGAQLYAVARRSS